MAIKKLAKISWSKMGLWRIHETHITTPFHHDTAAGPGMLFSDDGTMKGRRIFQSIHAVLPTATTCATIDGDRVYSIEGYLRMSDMLE
ncbi:hypothetical protein PHLCEN_2v6247 [Hermanssonia centrifuga]|uniref:Uncharacterized protein n=1 Tax=Hermanssonia centrifuga TaxID=98765 RepID=A0A2R6NZZ1_9APHY|nr:hypothetical protein PHLCEN_2v6247 [Hermanssonia centrifuga]